MAVDLFEMSQDSLHGNRELHFYDTFERRKRAKEIEERRMRLEWYYREHGRPPTWDELVAIRTYKENPK